MARRSQSGRGGYQAPASPAAYSPPGAFSQRTDSAPLIPPAPAGLEYGGRQAVNDQRQAIRAAAPTDSPAPQASSPPGRPAAPMASLFAPTDRPDEPVTAGLLPDLTRGRGAPDSTDDLVMQLQAIYAHAPNRHIREVLEFLSG